MIMDGVRPDDPPRPLEAYTRWLTMAVLLVALVHALIPVDQLMDDAYIFFRYVENFLDGHGLVWNAGGERVEGYTSFLYLVPLAILRSLGVPTPWAAELFNVSCFLGLVWAAGPLMARLGASPVGALIARVLIATHAYFASITRSGMEQAMLLLALAVCLSLRLRPARRSFDLLVSGTAFGLCMLTRPETVLVYGICVLWELVTVPRAEVGDAIRREVQRALGFAMVVVPHLLWRHHYYGDWVPNTYHAKVHVHTWSQLERGFKGFLEYLATTRGALLIIAAVFATQRPVRQTTYLLAAFGVTWVAWLVYLGLPNWGYYYSVPLDLFSILLISSTCEQALVADPLDGPQRRTLLLAVTAVLAATIGHLVVFGERARLVLVVTESAALLALIAARGRQRERAIALASLAAVLGLNNMWVADARKSTNVVANFVVIGKMLKEISRPGESVAVMAAGAIPYFSGLTAIDTLGLNDREIALTPDDEEAPMRPFGHSKGNGASVLRRRPTYLIAMPLVRDMQDTGYVPFERTFKEIFQAPEFKRDYEFHSVMTPGGGYFNYYKRR